MDGHENEQNIVRDMRIQFFKNRPFQKWEYLIKGLISVISIKSFTLFQYMPRCSANIIKFAYIKFISFWKCVKTQNFEIFRYFQILLQLRMIYHVCWIQIPLVISRNEHNPVLRCVTLWFQTFQFSWYSHISHDILLIFMPIHQNSYITFFNRKD